MNFGRRLDSRAVQTPITIRERLENSQCRSRAFEILRDLMLRCLVWYLKYRSLITLTEPGSSPYVLRWRHDHVKVNIRNTYSQVGICNSFPWWRHQMETFSALLAICAGNSPVNSPHKGQWRGALMFSLICARINGWVNNCEAGDSRRHRAHYYVIVMSVKLFCRVDVYLMKPTANYAKSSNACAVKGFSQTLSNSKRNVVWQFFVRNEGDITLIIHGNSMTVTVTVGLTMSNWFCICSSVHWVFSF